MRVYIANREVWHCSSPRTNSAESPVVRLTDEERKQESFSLQVDVNRGPFPMGGIQVLIVYEEQAGKVREKHVATMTSHPAAPPMVPVKVQSAPDNGASSGKQNVPSTPATAPATGAPATENSKSVSSPAQVAPKQTNAAAPSFAEASMNPTVSGPVRRPGLLWMVTGAPRALELTGEFVLFLDSSRFRAEAPAQSKEAIELMEAITGKDVMQLLAGPNIMRVGFDSSAVFQQYLDMRECVCIAVFASNPGLIKLAAKDPVCFVPGSITTLDGVLKKFGAASEIELWPTMFAEDVGLDGFVYWWGVVGVAVSKTGTITHVLVRDLPRSSSDSNKPGPTRNDGPFQVAGRQPDTSTLDDAWVLNEVRAKKTGDKTWAGRGSGISLFGEKGVELVEVEFTVTAMTADPQAITRIENPGDRFYAEDVETANRLTGKCRFFGIGNLRFSQADGYERSGQAAPQTETAVHQGSSCGGCPHGLSPLGISTTTIAATPDIRQEYRESAFTEWLASRCTCCPPQGRHCLPDRRRQSLPRSRDAYEIRIPLDEPHPVSHPAEWAGFRRCVPASGYVTQPPTSETRMGARDQRQELRFTYQALGA